MLLLWEQMGTAGWAQLYTDAPIGKSKEWEIKSPVVKVGDQYRDPDKEIWRVVEVLPGGVQMQYKSAPKAWGIRNFFVTYKELAGYKKMKA